MRPTECCDLHISVPERCCDPTDCGPCCPACPTCPELIALRDQGKPIPERAS